jgi:hypothetical protein
LRVGADGSAGATGTRLAVIHGCVTGALSLSGKSSTQSGSMNSYPKSISLPRRAFTAS